MEQWAGAATWVGFTIRARRAITFAVRNLPLSLVIPALLAAGPVQALNVPAQARVDLTNQTVRKAKKSAVTDVPQPVGNPGDWVGPSDYPSEALRNGTEGDTAVRVAVAADGTVTDCTIAKSSGDISLDDSSCRAIRANARFSPALDGDRHPVAGEWSTVIHWEIPGSDNVVPAPQFVVYTMTVEKDGSISHCTIEHSEGQKDLKPCALDHVDTIHDEAGNPVRKRVKVMYRVVWEDLGS
jgi:protein TonB